MENEKVFGIDSFYAKSDSVKWIKGVMELGEFRDRAEAEVDPEFQQIIPYIVFVKKEEDAFFSYLRSGSEERLSNYVSVGIGGHINPCDYSNDVDDMLLKNIHREIDEELSIMDINEEDILAEDLHIVGPEMVIRSTETDVNSVHLGLMYYCFLPDGVDVWMNNEGKEGQFRTFEELSNMKDSLETWSQIVLPLLG
jgi:predicted NUDIX family phosphoesterase